MLTSIRTLHNQAKTAMHRLDDVSQLQGKEQAAKQLLSLLGVGATTGFGIRGLMGLRDLMQNRQLPVSASASLPSTISVFGRPRHPSVPVDQEQPAKPLRKLAGLETAVPELSTGLNTAAKAIAPALPRTHTTNPILSEWGIPAGMMALGGGAYGGYKLLDWLLNKEQKMQDTNDLDNSQDDYRKALAEQYRAAMMAKNAGEDLGINTLADKFEAATNGWQEKAAFTMSALGAMFPAIDNMYSGVVGYDRYQALKGGANAAALATMLGTGKLTYDWAKKQNKRELLQKALVQRQMARRQMSPPPIIALNQDDPNAA